MILDVYVSIQLPSTRKIGDHGEPMPGKAAEDEELFEVCKAVGEFGRGFFEFNPQGFIYVLMLAYVAG